MHCSGRGYAKILLPHRNPPDLQVRLADSAFALISAESMTEGDDYLVMIGVNPWRSAKFLMSH